MVVVDNWFGDFGVVPCNSMKYPMKVHGTHMSFEMVLSSCMKFHRTHTYPFPNFNGGNVEVWEWINNFIPHLTWCNYLSMLGLKLSCLQTWSRVTCACWPSWRTKARPTVTVTVVTVDSFTNMWNIFFIISHNWDGTHSWNPSTWKTRASSFWKVNKILLMAQRQNKTGHQQPRNGYNYTGILCFQPRKG